MSKLEMNKSISFSGFCCLTSCLHEEKLHIETLKALKGNDSCHIIIKLFGRWRIRSISWSLPSNHRWPWRRGSRDGAWRTHTRVHERPASSGSVSSDSRRSAQNPLNYQRPVRFRLRRTHNAPRIPPPATNETRDFSHMISHMTCSGCVSGADLVSLVSASLVHAVRPLGGEQGDVAAVGLSDEAVVQRVSAQTRTGVALLTTSTTGVKFISNTFTLSVDQSDSVFLMSCGCKNRGIPELR